MDNNLNEYMRIEKGELALNMELGTTSDETSHPSITLRFTNTGSHDIHLSYVDVGENGTLYGNVFTVVVDGVELPYEGSVRDIELTADETCFKTLAPNEAYIETIPLRDYYAFPERIQGALAVTYLGYDGILDENSRHLHAEL